MTNVLHYNSSKNPKSKDNIFYVELVSGYTFKQIIDILNVKLKQASFRFDASGMFSQNADELEQLLLKATIPRNKMKKYRCISTGIQFNIDVSHLQKLLTNVRKKESISLWIEKGTSFLCYEITTKTASDVTGKREVGKITIDLTQENQSNYTMPEVDPHSGEKVYPHIVQLESKEFLRLKKLKSLSSKKFTLEICDTDSIRLCGGNANMYGSDFIYGEIPKDPSFFYKADFSTDIINLFSKMQNLSEHTSFYAPYVDDYPLKIESDNMHANLVIYIKDEETVRKNQIERETERCEKIPDHERVDIDELPPKKKSSKSKKAKSKKVVEVEDEEVEEEVEEEEVQKKSKKKSKSKK